MQNGPSARDRTLYEKYQVIFDQALRLATIHKKLWVKHEPRHDTGEYTAVKGASILSLYEMHSKIIFSL
jgi:hypothetical protein